MNKKELVGQVFGNLTVIETVPSIKGRGAWKCKCICSKEVIKTTAYLTTDKHKQKHCGCKLILEDLTGKQFNDFLVEKETLTTRAGRTYRAWKCKCVCGRYKIIETNNLTSGKLKSCGCKVPNRTLNCLSKTFGKLHVISAIDTPTTKSRKWNCLCACGKMIVLTTTDLCRVNKPKTNCGCAGIKTSHNNLIGKQFGSLFVNKETKSKRNKKAWECLCSCETTINVETSSLIKNIVTCCPSCSTFKSERDCIKAIETLLSASFSKIRTYTSRYSFIEFDGYNKQYNLAIEYQGEQHYMRNAFFHMTEQDFISQQERDEKKRKYCKENNIFLIEVPYTVKGNYHSVIVPKLLEFGILKIK